jgi:nucleoside triphosphate pyrophosphatase
MIKTNIQIYLASSSPRRKRLLQQLNIPFKTFSVDIDEKIRKGESPIKAVKRLSIEKMEMAKKIIKRGIIITADTIVVLDNQIIGKPKDKKEAERILEKLSGRTHKVYTGFSVFNSVNGEIITEYEKTFVKFRELNKKEIVDYISTGSPMDKAGAYGIQDDFGAVFVEKINGCYYNVVGLPLTKVYKSLLKVI